MIPLYRIVGPDEEILWSGYDRAAGVAHVVEDIRRWAGTLPMRVEIRAMDEHSRYRAEAVLTVGEKDETLEEIGGEQ